MVRLAQCDANTPMRSHDLAELEHLPRKFLESILLALRRGGFLESRVGSRGGYAKRNNVPDVADDRVADLLARLGKVLPTECKAAPVFTVFCQD